MANEVNNIIVASQGQLVEKYARHEWINSLPTAATQWWVVHIFWYPPRGLNPPQHNCTSVYWAPPIEWFSQPACLHRCSNATVTCLNLTNSELRFQSRVRPNCRVYFRMFWTSIRPHRTPSGWIASDQFEEGLHAGSRHVVSWRANLTNPPADGATNRTAVEPSHTTPATRLAAWPPPDISELVDGVHQAIRWASELHFTSRADYHSLIELLQQHSVEYCCRFLSWWFRRIC